MKITYNRKHQGSTPTTMMPNEILVECMPHAAWEYTLLSNGGYAVLQQITTSDLEPAPIWCYRLHNPSQDPIESRITMMENRMLLVVLLKGTVSAGAHPFNTISITGARYFPIFVPKGQPYSVVLEGEDLLLVQLSIGIELLDDLIRGNACFGYFKELWEREGYHALPLPDLAVPSAVIKIIQQFLNPAAPPVLHWKTHCKNVICQVLQAYLHGISKGGKRINVALEETLLFSRITYYIAQEIAKKKKYKSLSLPHLCGHFFYTDKQLQTLFKKRAGTTVMAFVRLERLVKGKYLLIREAHWSQQDVAMACGFSTEMAFRRAFTKQWGKYPNKFRKEELTDPNTLETKVK